ncbi:hypothetical protein CUN61_07730 [Pseudomonas arsenicoxydans]|uniref:Uncharacterized protein n=1 Tax=Pseudomonas arsenicoxydans TaxID=702115 RepID=A0A4P6GEL4_9PSED|nr:hypothetical protein CUN61_07730 [Pseudomonas arsenicoxydans]
MLTPARSRLPRPAKHGSADGASLGGSFPRSAWGMPHRTLRVHFWDAERPWLHSHAERGNAHEVRGPIRRRRPRHLHA